MRHESSCISVPLPGSTILVIIAILAAVVRYLTANSRLFLSKVRVQSASPCGVRPCIALRLPLSEAITIFVFIICLNVIDSHNVVLLAFFLGKRSSQILLFV